MMEQRAWIRLPSGRHLDLINPSPDAWLDSDLVVRLSRTPRWGGESSWSLPLSVAQHSLTVLALREQWSNYTLSPEDCLRELLHDAEEGFLGFDCISPLKTILGEPFRKVSANLMSAIETRYNLPAWTVQSHLLHKRADHIAAASEAIYCVGWSHQDMREILQITESVLDIDPLVEIYGCVPWEPWPPEVAVDRFQSKLDGLMEKYSRC